MEHERNRKRRKPDTGEAATPRKRNSPAARMAQELRREREAETQRRKREQARPSRTEQARPERPAQERSRPAAQPVRKERNSRGASEAQRRREDRRERARLDSLRDKQKKQAKQRTRKRISPDTWKRLCVMATVVLAVILTMVIFFRVHNVEVDGNHYYSAQEIVDAADISEGDNLLTLSRGQIAGNVIAKLPYIKSVRVMRHLPDSVVLRVTEYEATFAMEDTQGDYYLVTASGQIAQTVEEREAKAHVLVTEPKINPTVVGETVSLALPEGSADGQSMQNALLLLLQEIEQAELVKEVTRVEAASAHQLFLWYGDRFEVRLGNSQQLAYKLEFLKIAVAEQKDYASGVIDLTLNEGNQARIILDE